MSSHDYFRYRDRSPQDSRTGDSDVTEPRTIGLLFTGGEGPERAALEAVIDRNPFVVAADSGIDLARRIGVGPNLLVGDMDSISDRNILGEYPERSVMIFPEEKDETDTEIGLRLLFEHGCEEVVIAGGGGGRLDHLVGMLALFERVPAPSAWYTRSEEIVLITGSVRVHGTPGERVSFFPVGNETVTMSSSGLRWPLDTLVWRHGDAGISNIAFEGSFYVRMRSGRLLMIRDLDHGAHR